MDDQRLSISNKFMSKHLLLFPTQSYQEMRSIDSDYLKSSTGLSPISDEFSPLFPQSRLSNMKNSDQFMFTEPGFMKPINVEQVEDVKDIPQKVMNVVAKPYQDRSVSQNMLVGRFLLQLNIFKQLTNNLSPEAVKQMVKNGKLKLYQYGDIITTHGQKMRCLRILVNGQVGILMKQEKEQQDKGPWEVLQELVEKLGKESRNFKTKTTLHRMSIYEEVPMNKSFLSRQQTNRQDDVIHQQDLQTLTGQRFLDYQNLLEYEPQNSQSLIVTVDSTLIFTLSLEEFYQSLLRFNTIKQNNVLKLFRTVSFFNLFQNSKLQQLVEKMKNIELKKGQYLYKEGDHSNCFYLLTEGEVEITKTIGIFEENPNNLYKNRIKMSRQKIDLNIGMLPYADFKRVYNYHQQEKLITLSIINPISIFGEQELLQAKPRQVNAKVLSLKAKMYQINISLIEDFINKMAGNQNEKKVTLVDFFGMIEESVTLKKILFRQKQLSDMVDHQNKTKYQQMFEESNQKRANSSLKSNYNTRRSSTGNIFIRKQEDEAPPTFNNFNYTDFMNQNQPERQQNPSNPSKCYTEKEAKVVELTHQKYSNHKKAQKNRDKTFRLRNYSGTKVSSDKVTIDNMATKESLSSSAVKVRQRSYDAIRSHKSITLDEPLFTVKYFRSQQQKERKLVVVARKKKLQSIYQNAERAQSKS